MAFNMEHDPEERSYYYYWMDFGVNVHQGISNLWHEGFGTDFEIIAGGKSLRCHKIVIAAVSDYFKAMFNSGMQETEQDKVVFDDISSESFDTIFEILYPNERVEKRQNPLRNKSETDILELITLASRFQMQFLKTMCLSVLRTTLSCDNCVNRWKVGEDIQCVELSSMGRDFVSENFEELVPLRALDSLGYDDFLDIISDHDMFVENDENTWWAIRNWINFNPKERSQFITTLIKECCLTEIQTDFLMEEIAFDTLVRHDDEAARVVKEALQYKRYPSIHCNIDVKFRHCHDKEQVCVLLSDKFESQTLNDEMDEQQLKLKLIDKHNEIITLSSSESIVPSAKSFRNISYCVYGQSIFVLKGSIRNGADLLRYNSNGNEWRTLEPMGIALLGHTMCALDECLYVSGGKSGVHMNTHVWKYDINSDSWTMSGEFIVGVMNASSVAFEKKIYIFGGTTERQERLDCVQAYDSLTGTATIFCNLPKPCSFSRAILRRSTAYIVTSDGDVERISLDTAETALIASVSFKDKVSYGINMRSDELTIYTGRRRTNTNVKSLGEQMRSSSSSELSFAGKNVNNDVDDFVINVKTGAVDASRSISNRCEVLGCVSLVVKLYDCQYEYGASLGY